MTNPAPLICPNCKIPMNRHAEKPVDPRTAAEAGRAAVLVQEVHQCPLCGMVGSRHGTIGD